MKTFLGIVIMALLSSNAYSECATEMGTETVADQYKIDTAVPSHLKGKVYLVCDADGKNCESPVSSAKFKLVPRKQQFITQKTVQTDRVTCQSVAAAKKLKNRVSGIVGEGPNSGFDVSNYGNSTTVQNKIGVVGGVQYQRDTGLTVLGMPVHAGVQVQSNPSVLLDAGVSF